MSDIFYLRPVAGSSGPVVAADVFAMANEADGCFSLHRVDWAKSYLSADGDRMLCWYTAPDAESARMALRQLGSDMNSVWAGRVLSVSSDTERSNSSDTEPNVLIEQSFTEARTPEQAQDLQSEWEPHLQAQGAALLGGFLSNDGKHLVSVCLAADSASVDRAMATAGTQPDTVWECQVVDPSDSQQ